MVPCARRAFGYQQVLGSGAGGSGSGPSSGRQPNRSGGGGGPSARAQAAPPPPGHVPWNSSALVEDPNQEEHHILEHVVEGGLKPK